MKPVRGDSCPAMITFEYVNGKKTPLEGNQRHDCPGRRGPKSKGFRKSKGWRSKAWRLVTSEKRSEAILTRAVKAIVLAIIVVVIFYLVSQGTLPF
jgi:hypothetical protein